MMGPRVSPLTSLNLTGVVYKKREILLHCETIGRISDNMDKG